MPPTIRAPRRSTSVDFANAAGAFAAGMRRDAEEKREQAMRDALFALQQRGVELNEQEFAFRRGEVERQTGAAEAARGDLAQRIMQLDPRIKREQLDELTPEMLQSQLSALENRTTQLRSVELAHQYRKNEQLVELRRQQTMAEAQARQSGAAIKRLEEQVKKNPAYAVAYTQQALKDPAGADMFLRSKVIELAGRDIYTEWQTAGQAIADLRAQAMALSGGAKPGTPTPNAANVDPDLPFSAQTDEAKQAMLQAVDAALKAGQPVNVSALRSQGVPVDSLMAQNGTATQPTQPVAPTQPAMPAYRPGGFSMEQINNPQAMFAQPTPTPAPIGTGDMQRKPFTPPQPANFSNVQGGSSFGNVPQAAQQPAQNGVFTPQTPAPQSGTVAPGSRMPDSLPSAGTVAPSQPIMPDQLVLQSLQGARDVNTAEYAARELLRRGMPYDSVVAQLPKQYAPFVSAKLPRRLPQ
jgi:hypothetical protein